MGLARELEEARGASAWQLYDKHPKAGEAAKALTSALSQAKKELAKMVSAGLKTGKYSKDDFDFNKQRALSYDIEDLFDRILGPVMSTYADAGASDTEPRNVGRYELFQAAEKRLKWRRGTLP